MTSKSVVRKSAIRSMGNEYRKLLMRISGAALKDALARVARTVLQILYFYFVFREWGHCLVLRSSGITPKRTSMIVSVIGRTFMLNHTTELAAQETHLIARITDT